MRTSHLIDVISHTEPLIVNIRFRISPQRYRQFQRVEEKMKHQKELTSTDCYVGLMEAENKLSLIREGVPISIIERRGMDLMQQVKLEKNRDTIFSDVPFEEISTHLIQKNLLTRVKLDEIRVLPDQPARISALLGAIYFSGTNAYPSLRSFFKTRYPHIADALDDTVVDKRDIYGVSGSMVRDGTEEDERGERRQDRTSPEPKLQELIADSLSEKSATTEEQVCFVWGRISEINLNCKICKKNNLLTLNAHPSIFSSSPFENICMVDKGCILAF